MGKDLQRTLLWVILLTSCFMLWDNYQVYKGGESFFQGSQQESVTQTASTDVVPTDNSTDTVSAANTVQLGTLVVVKTDLMNVTFDLTGASLVKNEFTTIPRSE